MARAFIRCLAFATLSLVLAQAFASRGLTVEFKERESADAAVAGNVELYSNSYALVIGIDDYQTWPRLSQAISDAQSVAAALEKRGFDVTFRKNLKGRELEAAFEDFFIDKGADPNARLFIWYAGHGHTVDGEGYLIPADGVFEGDRGNFLRRSVSLRDFGKFARLARAKHVYTIFDSCFAGTIFTVARSAPPPAITRVTSEPVRQFLSSGDAGQTVSDDGTFARLFVEALDGKRRADLNGDGYVTAEELGSFLTTSISNYTSNKQVPRHGKLRDPNFDRGDFVFLASLTQGAPQAQTSIPQQPRQETAPARFSNLRRLPSGLQYEVLREGSSKRPTPTSEVLVRYEGSLVDGTVFDSSTQYGDEPMKLPLTDLVKGWQEGMRYIGEGGKIRLIVPPELGFGDSARPGVPANSTTIYDVELVEIIEAPTVAGLSGDLRTTSSGLKYAITQRGNGRKPSATSEVVVHYEGRLLNGKVFDSSIARKQPATFRLNQVIPGWTEGMSYVSEGGKIQLVIPPNLAYGERGAGGAIPPNSTLVFDVELLEVH